MDVLVLQFPADAVGVRSEHRELLEGEQRADAVQNRPSVIGAGFQVELREHSSMVVDGAERLELLEYEQRAGLGQFVEYVSLSSFLLFARPDG